MFHSDTTMTNKNTNCDEENESKYLRCIKNRCFLCEIEIHNNFQYYIKYGNCCVVCSSRATRRALDYKSDERMKEFLLEELKQRRILVKIGIIKEQKAFYI